MNNNHKTFFNDNMFNTAVTNKKEYVLINQIDKIGGQKNKVVLSVEVLDYLKNISLPTPSTSLYNGRLESNFVCYAIYDEDLESSVSFSNESELLNILNESPEYFNDDEILISHIN